EEDARLSDGGIRSRRSRRAPQERPRDRGPARERGGGGGRGGRAPHPLAGGTRAAVGPVEVAEAVEAGAAETILVSESLLPEPAVAPTLDRAREAHVRLFVVRDEGEAGKKLTALGRIAALLRYDWTSPSRFTGSPGSPRVGPRSGASGP